ncbi:MAG: hypothetical protein WBG86_18280 [Polyangiales bacterium]
MKLALAKRLMVEHVVREFNRLMRRLGIEVEFGLRGPDSHALEVARDDLASGQISMVEATNLALGGLT